LINYGGLQSPPREQGESECVYAREHGFSVCDNFIVSVVGCLLKSNLNKLLGIITATTLSYVEREITRHYNSNNTFMCTERKMYRLNQNNSHLWQPKLSTITGWRQVESFNFSGVHYDEDSFSLVPEGINFDMLPEEYCPKLVSNTFDFNETDKRRPSCVVGYVSRDQGRILPGMEAHGGNHSTQCMM
jgi:hypothetical protein